MSRLKTALFPLEVAIYLHTLTSFTLLRWVGDLNSLLSYISYNLITVTNRFMEEYA